MTQPVVAGVAGPPVLIHPEAPFVPVEQFRFSRRDAARRELTIRGDMYFGRGARTGVVLCHGFKGFGRWGFYPYFAPCLAAAGFNVVTFDFSGSGVGEDREAYADPGGFACNTYTQELGDIHAVVEESRARGWIAGRYGLFGHSRGGGDAILHAASTRDVAALVTWAAISHVLRWMPHQTEEWRKRGYTDIVNTRTGDVLPLNVSLLEECERLAATTLNVERAASEIRVPWLLVHGTADESVKVDDAHALYAAAGGKNASRVQLEIIGGANHVFGAAHPLREISPVLRELVARTVSFFTEHVGPGQVG